MRGGFEKSYAVVVGKGVAEEARRLLAKHSLLSRGLKPLPGAGGAILFPVVDYESAAMLLAEHGIPHEVTSSLFPRVKRPGRLRGPVRSYSVVGDIALFNWRREVPYEAYVEAAERVLGENPRLKAAWLKIETSGVERVARLEHLAGERKTETIVREYGVRLLVDVSKAYYNPRLAGEHHRVAELTGDGELVLDMFTGVGVFPIHIAVSRRAAVVGVDLNPEALRLAGRSLELNPRMKGTVSFVNSDARRAPLKSEFDRIIMNLPRGGIEFIPVACSLVKDGGVLHVYLLGSDITVAQGLVHESLARSGCSPTLEYAGRVIHYSPSKSIFAVDVRVRRVTP